MLFITKTLALVAFLLSSYQILASGITEDEINDLFNSKRSEHCVRIVVTEAQKKTICDIKRENCNHIARHRDPHDFDLPRWCPDAFHVPGWPENQCAPKKMVQLGPTRKVGGDNTCRFQRERTAHIWCAYVDHEINGICKIAAHGANTSTVINYLNSQSDIYIQLANIVTVMEKSPFLNAKNKICLNQVLIDNRNASKLITKLIRLEHMLTTLTTPNTNAQLAVIIRTTGLTSSTRCI